MYHMMVDGSCGQAAIKQRSRQNGHGVWKKAYLKLLQVGCCVSLQSLGGAGHKTTSFPYPPRFSDKNRFISSHLDAVLVAPISAKTKKQKQQTSNEGGWVLRSGRG